MAFNELIKNFDKIRDYIRDFYVYGFKTREDFNSKSLRSYDNEKRRIESYMGNTCPSAQAKTVKIYLFLWTTEILLKIPYTEPLNPKASPRMT